jgi:hypothetical protein
MSEKTWDDGLKSGAFKNKGTRKRKFRGKPEDKGRRRLGVRGRRMSERRK